MPRSQWDEPTANTHGRRSHRKRRTCEPDTKQPPWWKPTAGARVRTHGVPRQVVGRTQTPLPGADHQHAMGERQWDEPKLRFLPVLWLCLCGPARATLRRPTITSKKQPERLRERTQSAKNGAAAATKEDCGPCPSGSGAAEAAGKTGAPLRGIRTASQKRSVGTPHAVIW